MSAVVIPQGAPVPPDGADLDAVLEWAGRDVERLHGAYYAEMNRHPGARRAALLTQLTHLLGWPAPDSPPGEVLSGAGTPGVPVGRVLAVEVSRPAWARRPGLIAELAVRTRAAGANAHSMAPAHPPGKLR